MTAKSERQGIQIAELRFPRLILDAHAAAETDLRLEEATRFEFGYLSPTRIRAKFGIQLTDSDDGDHAVMLQAEAEAVIVYKLSFDLPERAAELPMVASVLMLLFPFLREKINYLSACIGLNLLLDPMDIHGIIKSFK